MMTRNEKVEILRYFDLLRERGHITRWPRSWHMDANVWYSVQKFISTKYCRVVDTTMWYYDESDIFVLFDRDIIKFSDGSVMEFIADEGYWVFREEFNAADLAASLYTPAAI